MTTLISMIGKGTVIRNDGQPKGYDKVTYSFENGPEVLTSCSTNAILKSGLYSIDHVVVIGTSTSAWGELLDDPMPEEEEIFLQLLDVSEKSPFAEEGESSKKLKAMLKKRWNVKDVSFVVHKAELTSNVATDIYGKYVEKSIGLGKSIILDVTHGLRWMPMFLLSSIWYKETVEHGLASMTILYGELKMAEKQGIIRPLDALWKGQKIAEAMSLFIDKFDSDKLVQYLPDECRRFKEALVDFGNYMQADFLLPLVWDRDDRNGGYPLGKKVKQMRNGISDVNKIEQRPIWLERVINEMAGWVKSLDKLNYPSERLLVLADMYAERQLWGQAVMALDVVLRIFACERYQSNKYPDWDAMKNNLDNLIKDLKNRSSNSFKSIKKKDYEDIIILMHTRNMIAHGAVNSSREKRKTEPKPNLSQQFDDFKKALNNLLACRIKS